MLERVTNHIQLWQSLIWIIDTILGIALITLALLYWLWTQLLPVIAATLYWLAIPHANVPALPIR